MKNKYTEATRVEDCLALADSVALRFLNIPGYGPDELRQEARKLLHDAWDAFEGAGLKKAAFPVWARRSIRNRLIDIWRKETRLAGKTESLNVPDEGGGELVDQIADTWAGADVPNSARHAESIRVFHEALAKLTGEERAVLTAVMAEKSYAEIGREHGGISKEAVRKRFWKAATRLREVLGDKGFSGVTQSGVLISKKTSPPKGADERGGVLLTGERLTDERLPDGRLPDALLPDDQFPGERLTGGAPDSFTSKVNLEDTSSAPPQRHHKKSR